MTLGPQSRSALQPAGTTQAVGRDAGLAVDFRQRPVRMSLTGVFDKDSTEVLRCILDGLLAGRPERLVVDVAGLTSMHHAGPSPLLQARRVAAQWGGVLQVEHPAADGRFGVPAGAEPPC